MMGVTTYLQVLLDHPPGGQKGSKVNKDQQDNFVVKEMLGI